MGKWKSCSSHHQPCLNIYRPQTPMVISSSFTWKKSRDLGTIFRHIQMSDLVRYLFFCQGSMHLILVLYLITLDYMQNCCIIYKIHTTPTSAIIPMKLLIATISFSAQVISKLPMAYGSPYASALKSKCHVRCWFVVPRYWNYVLSILPFILGLYHHFPMIYHMIDAFEQSPSLSLCIQYSNVPHISPFMVGYAWKKFHLPCPMGPMGIHRAQKCPWNPGCTSPDNDATSLFTTHH